MENSYGIGIANRYAIFLEEEDPLEVLKAQEQEREAKKKSKLLEKENKIKSEDKGKPTQVSKKGVKESLNVKTLDSDKSEKENNKTKTASQSVPNKNDQNVRFSGELREENNNKYNKEDWLVHGSGEFNKDGWDHFKQNGNEVRNRGRGMGRGRGGFRGGRRDIDNQSKREFDRQSGSDKVGNKQVDKRDGVGMYNWGKNKDDENVHVNPLPQTFPTETEEEWVIDDVPPLPESLEVKETETSGNAEDDDKQLEEAEAEAEPEPEPQELTLDEYYAMRGTRQKPTYNLRKAGEGEDLTQWKKMYALKKKEEEEEEEEYEEIDPSEFPQRVGRQKYLLDIDIHFTDSPRSRGRGRGRGGFRGTGRGGLRGTGTPRGGITEEVNTPRAFGNRNERFFRGDSYQSRTQRQSAPKVDDEKDFPSLD